MKQRNHVMQGGDDMFAHTNNNKFEGDSSDIQLHKMKPQEHYIEAQVQEGDTLQAIALRFYCSISELKRINHIHKDNEIYARRTVKIPVTPYSVLTERLPMTHPGFEPIPSTSAHIQVNNSIQELIQPSSQKSNNAKEETSINNSDFAIDCNSVVMNSTLSPSLVPYTDSEVTEAVSEDTQLLPNKQKISVEAVVVKELTSHGADLGLKWFHLVCCMLVLGVVIPIVYVMFYLQKPDHEHINSTSNNML
ncbi:unnamed protein product [Chilo suppressalis]|uniref:LysM domain-containing protein n=1 Tax=Chilo suppressalis TaxID=168631 RepID=A0ABN8AY86_CHISP|nr:hypothetical protein evm_007645 [Chilo suppressalis]CAH0401321.1 unnamed protein product [Chilo suppressalis]